MSKNSAAAQRDRLLSALQHGPVDTQHASRKLDIIHPPRRVFELRKLGYAITTTWVNRVTEAGEPHRVGLYTLENRTEATRLTHRDRYMLARTSFEESNNNV